MTSLLSRFGALRRCRRASVAIYVALLSPVLAGSVALGVEVTSWAGAQSDLQRIADASAFQAAVYCYQNALQTNTCTNSTTVAQTAATLAAKLAEVNGVTGSSSPTWTGATKTYSDNDITTSVVTGVKHATDAAVQVSLQQTIPLTIAQLVNTTGSETISATSTSEVVTTAGVSTGSGAQPCMLALNTAATSLGITASGSITVDSPGCTLVSNSNFNDSGAGTFTMSGIYAVGAIPTSSNPSPSPSLVIPCWAVINGSNSNTNGCATWPANGDLQSNTYVHPQSASVSDPYASNTAMQSAISGAGSTTGPNLQCYNQHCYYGPTYTASISGTTMTVTAVSHGTLATGQSVAGTSVNSSTTITALVSGTGGTGTYTVSKSQTIASETMTGWAAVPGSSGSSLYGTYCTGQGGGSVTCYLQPGNYGSFQVTSGGPYTFNFAAGGYVFNGAVSLTNNTTSNGTGVTIFTTGTFNGANTFNFYLSAPSTTVNPNPSSAGPWQIAGVVLAGSASDTTTSGTLNPVVTLSGNPQFQVSGVVYFPNGTFNSQGSNGLGSSSTACLELIAGNIELSGNSYLGSSCSGYNAITFDAQPGAPTTSYAARIVK
jgi:hypothetical protein